MLEEYVDAFAGYLRTGAVGALSVFCAGDADLRRLRVYRNGFLRGSIEALRANYPSVERLVGAERFPALARPYVETFPPRDANLAAYGEGFPRFIEEAHEFREPDWLVSFAALDRAWSEVYFAADAGDSAGLDAAAPPARLAVEMARCPQPGGRPDSETQCVPGPQGDGSVAAGTSGDAESLMGLRGRLAPWVRLVSLDHCALAAWSRLRADEADRPTEVRRASQQVLIWRGGDGVLYRELAPPEHGFVAGVAAGHPCGEAAAAALDTDPEFDLASSFASLLHHRVLSFER